MRLAVGIGYYRFPVTIPYLLILIPVLIAMMHYGCRHLPKPKQGVKYALILAITALLFVPQHYGFDAKKYELMEYDYLVRIKDWNGIIAKAEQQTPDKPMSVSATNLALAMTNQLGERAFEFYLALKVCCRHLSVTTPRRN